MVRLNHLTNVSKLAAQADVLSVSGRTRSIRTGTTVGLGVLSGRAIMAVGEFVLKGVEVVQIKRTLHTASTNVRNSQRRQIDTTLGARTINDLLELQR